MDQLGFYFLPGGCGLSGSAQGTFANIASPSAFSISSLFESGTQGGNAPLGVPVGFWLIGAAVVGLLLWRH